MTRADEKTSTPFHQRNDVEEHVVLVAATVYGTSAAAAQQNLQQGLATLLIREDETSPVESWWIAEDTRDDGSDCDSAVFVSPGNQPVASALLHAAGLSPSTNVVIPQPEGQFGIPDGSVNLSLDEVKARLREWLAEGDA